MAGLVTTARLLPAGGVARLSLTKAGIVFNFIDPCDNPCLMLPVYEVRRATALQPAVDGRGGRSQE
jgi:hypothetical protein